MTTLNDLYSEELQDLWSAHEQLSDVVSAMADKASDSNLADRLSSARNGIGQHTRLLRSPHKDTGAEVKKEHCKGMEGLVKKAKKHALDVAGLGMTKAVAEALGYDQVAHKLGQALDSIYESDDFMAELAERSRNVDAKAWAQGLDAEAEFFVSPFS